MKSLIIRNVRCFTEPDPAPLAPLTFLVGENSTGKSTFLALTRLAWDAANLEASPNFNEEPFLLGGYNDIANYRGGRWRADSFSVGFILPPPSVQGPRRRARSHAILSDVEFVAEFINRDSQAELNKWCVKAGEYGVTLAFGENSQIKSIALDTPTGHCEISRVIGAPPLHFLSSSGFLKFIVSESEQKPSGASSVSGDRPDEVELDTLAFLIWHVRDAIASRPYATAPVRTKPQRTYDPITDAQ